MLNIVHKNRKIEAEYVSMDELYQAYRDCLKRKISTINALDFEIDDYNKLYQLYIELNNKTYTIGKSIAFCVEKPVKREIFAADFKDRIVHHLVMNRILKYFENDFIDKTFSCRVGKGTEYGVKCLYNDLKEITCNFTKEAYVIKCDLKSFFMSLPKQCLYDKIAILLQTNYKEDNLDFWLHLIHNIIFNEPQKNCLRKQHISHWNDLPSDKSLFSCKKGYGLPIGNLTSQIFANFYLSEFDHWITTTLGIKYYGRYVDDFYILLPWEEKDKTTELYTQIKEKLDSMGVTLHPKKFYHQPSSKGVKFIGSVIKYNRVYIANRTKGNFYNLLSQMNIEMSLYKQYQKDYILLQNIKYYVNAINSYLGFLRHKKSFNIRYKMLSSVLIQPLYQYCYPNASLTKLIICSDYRLIFSKNKKKPFSSTEIKDNNYITELFKQIYKDKKLYKTKEFIL